MPAGHTEFTYLKLNIFFKSAKDKRGIKTRNEQKGDAKTMSNNSSNRLVNPAAREAMDKFKMEAASELGVLLTY